MENNNYHLEMHPPQPFQPPANHFANINNNSNNKVAP